MLDIMDLHTHTLASGHGYSTIRENAEMAAKRGLQLLGITEHGPTMDGSCHISYFEQLKVVDRDAYPVKLLLGAEVNILDDCGTVDLEQKILEEMDIGIAGFHMYSIKRRLSKEYATQACIRAMANPYINVLSHPDDYCRFPLDYPAVIQAAKENNVLIELNNNSLNPNGERCRWGAIEANRELMQLCKQYEVPILVSSDAHVDTAVGRHDYAWEFLSEMAFPDHLVVNRSIEAVKPFLNCFRY